MHATEREALILAAMEPAGFVSYHALEAQLGASPATIRRDLARMVDAGLIVRVLDCQVLTNSLHIVAALLGQPGTRILVPSGTVFREQNIILAPAGEDSMPRS